MSTVINQKALPKPRLERWFIIKTHVCMSHFLSENASLILQNTELEKVKMLHFVTYLIFVLSHADIATQSRLLTTFALIRFSFRTFGFGRLVVLGLTAL